MKRYNKIITVLYAVVFICYSILSNGLKVSAHQSGDNIAYRESAVNVSLVWGFYPNVGAYKYYVDDASGIPTGGGYYFWKYGENNKFAAVSRENLFAYVFNNGLGLTVKDTRLNELITAYYGQFTNVEAGYLYDGVGNKLGICLNDITGCTYERAPNNTNIDIPSTEINNIYNWYHYHINVEDPEVPDYINIKTPKFSECYNLIDVNNPYRNAANAMINNVSSGYIYGFNTATNSYQYTCINWKVTDSTSYYSNNLNKYTNFCTAFNLYSNGDTVDFTKFITGAKNQSLEVRFYDKNTTNVINCPYTRYTLNSNGTYTTNDGTYATDSFIDNAAIISTENGDTYTVYKNDNVFTTVVNNTYAPSVFTSNKYNNFDVNNTENISTNNSVVNNATTTNNDIYNDASQSFSEYYSSQDSYNIDNSVVIENTTEIIYNYYGNGDNPDPNPNPNPDDDDTIWKALLKAIADFFKKLGELIVTVLTGIVTILTSILEAIATIVTDFTGITDFLGQIFAWLPSEIITLMTLGLTTALFAAFLTWFKK